MGQKTFFIVAVITAVITLYLSFQYRTPGGGNNMAMAIAAVGGAVGFGIISASCFVSAALLRRSSDQTKEYQQEE